MDKGITIFLYFLCIVSCLTVEGIESIIEWLNSIPKVKWTSLFGKAFNIGSSKL